VRLEGRPGDQPERGAQPFNTKRLTKLRQAVGADSLAFILLRWTGLRGSDAVGLRWEEIDWETREINRLTLKRRKRVILPIHQELFFALEIEFSRRNPQPEDRVLQNLSTRKPFTRPRLHERMLALGRRAGELDAPRIGFATRSLSICSLAVLHPTMSRSCSATRSRPSRSITPLSFGNCASARGESWKPAKGWNRWRAHSRHSKNLRQRKSIEPQRDSGG
jgi:integrase